MFDIAFSPQWSSILLALGGSLCFSTGIQFVKHGLRYSDSASGTVIAVVCGTSIFWVLAPFLIPVQHWFSHALWIFAAIGLFRPALSANLSNAGTKALGPTISATVAASAPLFAAIGGIFFLSETLTWPVALGTAMVVGGAVAISWKNEGKRTWAMWALLYPLGAAFFRALAHIFAKYGMDILPDPLMASLVSNSVSVVGLVAHALWRRSRGLFKVPWKGTRFFIIAGFINGSGVLFVHWAIHLGKVIWVAPVVAASPVFTMLLSTLVFHHERITMRLCAAVLLVTSGVALIGLLH